MHIWPIGDCLLFQTKAVPFNPESFLNIGIHAIMPEKEFLARVMYSAENRVP